MIPSIPDVARISLSQPWPVIQKHRLPVRNTFTPTADSLELRFGHIRRNAPVEEKKPLVDPNRVKIFTGRSNTKLAREVAQYLGMELSLIWLKNHRSSETHVELKESVQGRDVFLIQSTSAPADKNLMELLLMVDAAKQDDAKSVTAIIPYYGYARQDRRTDGKIEPIASKLVAKQLKTAGADRVVLLDLHNTIQEGFFDIPVTHLSAAPLLGQQITEAEKQNAVVVSPDAGGVVRARTFAQEINLPYVIIEKRRTAHGEAEALNIIGGDITGKVCIIFDDMIDTAGTISKAATLLLKAGAGKVIAVATHPVFSNPADKHLANSVFERVIVSNSIPVKPTIRKLDLVTSVSVAPLIGEVIRRISRAAR